MSIPAGWYDDGTGTQRWWDGSSWSDTQVQIAVPAGEPESQKSSFLGRAGSAARKVADDYMSRRQQRQLEQQRIIEAAGRMLVADLFGSSLVEVYEGGYVRIESKEKEVPVTPKAPYEKLLSVTFTAPTPQGSNEAESDVESVAFKAVTSLKVA